MNLVFKGRAWVFGDDVPNDEGIMPLAMTRAQEYDPQVLAQHCFEQVEPRFVSEARAGDIVIGGRNFGFGNPHIQGFLGLKGAGVGLVVESMMRGPLRTCVNAGVPVLCPVPEIRTSVETGDEIEVDFSAGRIRNLSRSTVIEADPLPPLMQEIITAGGGIGHMRQRLELMDSLENDLDSKRVKGVD